MHTLNIERVCYTTCRSLFSSFFLSCSSGSHFLAQQKTRSHYMGQTDIITYQ